MRTGDRVRLPDGREGLIQVVDHELVPAAPYMVSVDTGERHEDGAPKRSWSDRTAAELEVI
jgi:hypothetical protein